MLLGHDDVAGLRPSGTFTAQLTVTDDAGATSHDSVVITVSNEPPSASADAARTATP